jgi:hypothetical protein
MITTCRIRRVDAEVPPHMATEFSLRNLMSTWNPQFEPFQDEDQWPCMMVQSMWLILGCFGRVEDPGGESGKRWTWTEPPKEDQP